MGRCFAHMTGAHYPQEPAQTSFTSPRHDAGVSLISGAWGTDIGRARWASGRKAPALTLIVIFFFFF